MRITIFESFCMNKHNFVHIHAKCAKYALLFEHRRVESVIELSSRIIYERRGFIKRRFFLVDPERKNPKLGNDQIFIFVGGGIFWSYIRH